MPRRAAPGGHGEPDCVAVRICQGKLQSLSASGAFDGVDLAGLAELAGLNGLVGRAGGLVSRLVVQDGRLVDLRLLASGDAHGPQQVTGELLNQLWQRVIPGQPPDAAAPADTQPAIECR